MFDVLKNSSPYLYLKNMCQTVLNAGYNFFKNSWLYVKNKIPIQYYATPLKRKNSDDSLDRQINGTTDHNQRVSGDTEHIAAVENSRIVTIPSSHNLSSEDNTLLFSPRLARLSPDLYIQMQDQFDATQRSTPPGLQVPRPRQLMLSPPNTPSGLRVPRPF